MSTESLDHDSAKVGRSEPKPVMISRRRCGVCSACAWYSEPKAPERVFSSELGLILAGESLGTRRRGSKPGGGTEQAFAGIAEIARNNDQACNRAIGTALDHVGLVEAFETEKTLGTELVYASDLYVVQAGEPIRLEVMWRSKAGRADIANYVLMKLGNYGRAIGLLD